MERRLQGLEDKMPPSRTDPPLKSRPMTRAVSFTNALVLCRGPQNVWEIGVIGGSCQTGTAAPAGSAPRGALQQILEQSWHCRICLPPWTCSATPLRAFLPTSPNQEARSFISGIPAEDTGKRRQAHAPSGSASSANPTNPSRRPW